MLTVRNDEGVLLGPYTKKTFWKGSNFRLICTKLVHLIGVVLVWIFRKRPFGPGQTLYSPLSLWFLVCFGKESPGLQLNFSFLI